MPPIGEVILQGAGLFLSATVSIIEAFADLTWADTEISLSGEGMIMFFVVLGMVMWYQAVRPRWAMRFIGAAQSDWAVRGLGFGGVVIALLLFSRAADRPDNNLHLTFLDVGQGNGVLIQTPKGGAILIDGGEFPSRLLDALGDALPNQKRQLDAVFVTTDDDADIGALPEILERYDFGAVVMGDDFYAPTFAERLQAEAVPIVTAQNGYALTTDDGLNIEVVYPEQVHSDEESEPEKVPMVLRVTYGEAVFLLTNAIDAELESILLQNPHRIQATVLQVADHGDGDASSRRFLRVVNPQAAVIQLDETRAPSPTVIDRLSGTELFRTDQDGAVKFVTDGDQLWIYPENGE